jgi:hypothetical protein
LIVAGVAGIVTSTVLACRATLKADDVVQEAKSKIDKIHEAKEVADKTPDVNYSEQAYKKDMSVTYLQAGWGFVKLYAPAVLLGTASIACIIGSHGIMRKRNLALVAAYKAIEESFNKYRKRVVEEVGEDKDREFKNGIRKNKITVTETNEDGTTTKSKKVVETVDPSGISEYAKFFDSASSQWSDIPDYNLTFLKCQQNHLNDLLNSRGHVFLNEVYDTLGLPRTTAGQVVGWVKGYGDDYIDFGIFDDSIDGYRGVRVCDTVGEERRDFVNGYRDSILLDFNVAGVIYDMI